jgi:hypothetical protein
MINLRRKRTTFVIAVSIITLNGACGGDERDVGAAAALDAYRAAYNAHDIDGVVDTFADDAVITGHPLDEDGTTTGADEIRALHEYEMPDAAPTDAYELTNVAEESDKVTFGHRWHTKGGDCYSGGGHTVTVEDGKIVSWVWGTAGYPCGS